MKLFTKRSRKGQVAGIANGFQALVLAALMLGVTVIIAAFMAQKIDNERIDAGVKQCSIRTDTYTRYNSTSNLCYNSTGATRAVLSSALNVTYDGLTGYETLSEGAGDVADVSVITIILTLLFGVLAIFGIGYVRNR